MKLGQVFINRPIFAAVISLMIVIIGALSYFYLPVSQYPEVAPPTIEVRAYYPGAGAVTVANNVASILEQEINGVANMMYMTSQSTADGTTSIQVAFELGTDLDKAEVQVQNRVANAEPRLPETVRRLGITTKKISANMLSVVNMYSPNGTYDLEYIGNYAVLNVVDQLARVKGIGDVEIFGAAEYAMRIWLDPDKIANYGLSASEVVQAIRSQNVQVASGSLNKLPADTQQAYEINIHTQGKFNTPEEFENVIVKASENGDILKIKDIGHVSLGSQNYASKGYFGKNPAIAIPIYQKPGGNALESAAEVERIMRGLAERFPADLAFQIEYNPTQYIQESIDRVYITILEAIGLVVLVVLLFLQSWRAAVIPILAIPVSLIGTFAFMHLFGFSLNNLSLFGLVLAIGIVVDDAIVVVENIERYLEEGLSPKEAAKKTMNEVGLALIAMGLVLVAVFLPTAFLDGITGQFYRQFGLTIAVATAISVVVSLTLSPALGALLMRKPNHGATTHPVLRPFSYLGNTFNAGLVKTTRRYELGVKKVIRLSGLVMAIFLGLFVLSGYQFSSFQKGFIPAQDQKYFFTAIQLPPGSSLSRTDEVVQKALDTLLAVDGVKTAVSFTGFDGATGTTASNAATIFVILDDFEIRAEKNIGYDKLLGTLRAKMMMVDNAFAVVIPPPPVPGIGNAGGFKMMVQDRGNLGSEALLQATYALAGAANSDPALANVFTFFNTQSPQLYLDIDRNRAQQLGVPISEILSSLEVYLGSVYVNEFNYLGKTFQVIAQADISDRTNAEDIQRIKVKNNKGESVPLGSVLNIEQSTGPARIPHFNLYPAAALIGDISPGFSSGEALERMEQLAAETLPEGISFEWTELAYEEKQTGNTAILAFLLAVLFVFLLLAAQFESLVMPVAVILIMPMVILSSLTGIAIAGLSNDIMVQIGLVVLVGLASKNAILILEFARQMESKGEPLRIAVIKAARLRLRPILMTAFAFILGVVPLVISGGAGSELRQSLGIAVFSGMLGVTFFGLFLTPVFYYLIRKYTSKMKTRKQLKLKRILRTPVNHVAVTVLLAGSILLSACTTQKRGYDLPQKYGHNDIQTPMKAYDTLNITASEPVVEWWRAFNDSTLDSLIIIAQDNNRNIWAAIANYHAAHAAYKNRKLDRLPELNINGAYTRTRLGETIFVPGLNPTFSQYDAFFSSNWELDFFGRASNRAKGAYAGRQLSLAELNQAKLVITSEVARTYFNLLGISKRIRITEKNLEEREQAYELTTALSKSGLGNDLDVSRASAQVEQTNATLLLLAAEKELAKNHLSTLLGYTDWELVAEGSEMPDFPNSVPQGNLYHLIRNRPDVLAAENAVRVRIARYNMAVADLYPSISINGNAGFSAVEPEHFGLNLSFAWSFMPNISWAGFNMGRVKQKIKAEDAATIAALSQYEQTVLVAFEELKNNWFLLANEIARNESLRKVFLHSERAATLAKQRYNAGIDDFFDYLLANEALLSAEDAMVQNRQLVLNYYVNLHKAIGMGWQQMDEKELRNKYEQVKNSLEPSN